MPGPAVTSLPSPLTFEMTTKVCLLALQPSPPIPGVLLGGLWVSRPAWELLLPHGGPLRLFSAVTGVGEDRSLAGVRRTDAPRFCIWCWAVVGERPWNHPFGMERSRGVWSPRAWRLDAQFSRTYMSLSSFWKLQSHFVGTCFLFVVKYCVPVREN